MRLALGDLQFTPSPESCLPYICGADPGNVANRYACAIAGFAGAKSCSDPDCAPYCPNPSLTPYLTPAQQPAPTPAAPAIQSITLTPYNITQPFPDITRTLQPVIVAPPCTAWGDLNAAIDSSPLLAAGALLGLWFLLRKK